MAKHRYAACMNCRSEAQKVVGITDAQRKGLSLGSHKGTNHLEGIPKSIKSNRKRSESHKKWCAANPDKVKARGEKTRGENHYHWNGGSSVLNQSIRTMTEHRKWMDAVKARDGKCLNCESLQNLEAHHIIPLAALVEKYNIQNREQARNCLALWNLSNGHTSCTPCHYKFHGRTYAD